MPEIATGDLTKLAFPAGVRQQFSVMAWQSQRKYFFIMLLFGCLLFLLGAMM